MAKRMLNIAMHVFIAYAIAGNRLASAQGKLGEPCATNFTCTQENTVCQFGFCECPFGYFEDLESVSCVKGAFNGQPCGEHTYCWERNSQCVNNKCVCPEGFRYERKECVPEVKALGESCVAHAQCITQHSQCLNGTCRCAGGLEMDNGKCKVKTAYCIAQPAPLESGQPKQCSLQLDGTHTCPDNMECIPSDQPMIVMDGMTISGICCPTSAFEVKSGQGPLQCAIGEQAPVAGCYDEHWETHFLISYDVTGETICCPRACTNERILYNGECYDSLLMLNDECKISFQCFPGAECQNGRCVCKKDRKLIDGFCYADACPAGQALTNDRNETLSCVNSSCPEDYFCIKEFDMCCPLSAE